nr:DNA repair and recombination protein [Moesziomyces parantarcticus]
MNSAAIHSAQLIAEFEKQQQASLDPQPTYPSEYPFGSLAPGPFGGASSAADPSNAPTVYATNTMNDFVDTDAAHSADVKPSSTDERAYQPRPLTHYDYPGGWGAQTFSGVGGLTQDSASRIATLQAKLNQRLGPEYLSQRPGPGGGKKLTYIEGWKLVDLANEVFGFNGWSTEIRRLEIDFLDGSPDGTRWNAGVTCIVRVTLRDGAFHEDVGYGSADNARQKHAALEKGKKEAVTDATKRALKNFGKLLGNCTYDHQYSTNALKLTNPMPKFDPAELHRRPELRPPPPPQPQPPQPSVQAGQPSRKPASAPAPVPARSTSAERTASTTYGAAEASTSAAAAAPRPAVAAVAAAPAMLQEAGTDDASKDSVSERQQRSMLARQAYLERQQAEARKAAAAVEPHAEMAPSSDSFDDGLLDELAAYDESAMAEAEAASHALEMQIDARPSDDSGDVQTLDAADDSGVAFAEPSHVAVKLEKVREVEMRRSTSPVKQVKADAVLPRRAGSVGRFVSPPPAQAAARPIRNGATSLSAASSMGRAPAVAGGPRRFASALGGGVGVEGAVPREAGRALGEPVNHAYVPLDGMRGVKRPSENVGDTRSGPAAPTSCTRLS